MKMIFNDELRNIMKGDFCDVVSNPSNCPKAVAVAKLALIEIHLTKTGLDSYIGDMVTELCRACRSGR